MSQAGDKNLIARRYSRVLLLLSQEKKKESEVSLDLSKLSELTIADHDRWSIITSPAFNREKQMIVAETLKKGLSLTEISSNFLKVLIEHGRLGLLTDIIKHYQSMVEESKGIIKATFKSAHLMPESEVSSIVDLLKKKVKKEIRVEQVTDPKMIGGIQVYLGSILIDTSLKTRIDRMRQAMKG